MTCCHCGRGWRDRRFRRIHHTRCWIALGFSPILLSDQGERYLRTDPVPPAPMKDAWHPDAAVIRGGTLEERDITIHGAIVEPE